MTIPNWEKYPETWAEFDKARKALKPLMAKREKHMVAMNKVADKMQILADKKDDCHSKACADLEQIRDLRNEIARLAKKMGAISA